ncbi:hypothetical protein [Thauera sp.]|uniref:hypothetical protein n=1 Tax=Thauera sp. TaxID=1905334 RepID=UPI002B634EA9|nr:hypothetical protein [Thauera sp.]HRO35342.1 hypothetical protein [Thauera sp.]
MTTLTRERRELQAFSASVTAGAARSLDLLRDIEITLAWLNRLTGMLRADAEFAESANADLEAISCPIDPDDAIQDDLENAQREVKALYDILIDKRQAGRDDRRLTEDDGIEAAYTEAIAQAADLHNAINALRWNIGEHDIDATPQPKGPVYAAEDIDALFDDLLGR